MHVATVPPAEIALDGPSGAEIRALGSWDGELAAGTWTVRLAAPGFARETRVLAVTGPTSLDVWLDRPGQLLDLVRIFPTGHQPKAVLIVDDELWATNLDGPPSVYVHDLATGALKGTIDLGDHGAVELAVDAAHHRIWASQMETARVYEIDRASRSVTRVLRTRSNWTKVLALSADERRLYASNWNFDDVSVLDLATGAARRIPTVKTPRGLYVAPSGVVLVAGFGTGDLAEIDPVRGTSRTIWSSGGALREIVGRGDLAFVSDMHAARIFRVDTRTGAVTALGRTDPNPNTIDVSPDGQVVFASSRGPNGEGGYLDPSGIPGSVIALDTADGRWLDAVACGTQTTGLDLSDDGRTLAVSDFNDGMVRIYAVPSTEALRGGGGGRTAFHRADLRARR